MVSMGQVVLMLRWGSPWARWRAYQALRSARSFASPVAFHTLYIA